MTVDAWHLRPSAERIAALTALAVGALRHWGAHVADPELFLEGENAVFRVALDGVGPCALRVHRADYHTAKHLQSQIDWCRALVRDDVVHTAEVFDTIDGRAFVLEAHPDVPEPRFVSVLRWEPGESLDTGGVATPATYETLGSLMASMHVHGETWVDRSDFSAMRWDADSFIGDHAILGPFWDTRLLDHRDRTMMCEFRRRARVALDEFGSSGERFGIVHGDLLPQNLLLHEGTITVLDFDDCGHGWYLMDVATALMRATFSPRYEESRDAFLSGYRTRRAIESGDLSLLPLMLALRTATYVGWVETHPHTPAAQQRGAAIVRRGVDAARRYLDEHPTT